MLFIILYIFNLVDPEENRDMYFLNTAGFMILKIIMAFLLVIYIEFLVFFNRILGRVFYFNYFVLLTLSLLIFYYFYSNKKKWIGVLSKKLYEELLKDNFRFKNELVLYSDMEKKREPNIYLYNMKEMNEKELFKKVIEKKLLSFSKFEEIEDFIEKEERRISLRFFNSKIFFKDINNLNSIYLKTTRFFNIVISFFGLLILFPIGLLIALINRVFSKGRIIYKQERVGEFNRRFILLKFRTMKYNSEDQGPKFASENDPRITRIGQLMRKIRLDEVPQLINVLKGEMNLVGPRPERQIFIEQLVKEMPYYRLRTYVKPGLTGWAQVNMEYAGDKVSDHRKKLEYDLYYIKNRSLVIDSLVLFKTIKTVLNFRGK